jgi:hypothetical protein
VAALGPDDPLPPGAALEPVTFSVNGALQSPPEELTLTEYVPFGMLAGTVKLRVFPSLDEMLSTV